ncbi:MAG TPA: aromatic acid exporter family protein [Puia sp.]|nr:aromatic acid exporter family protein [Puia sp.]
MQSRTAFFKRLAPNAPYIIKCLIGVAVCYFLYVEIPQYPFYWAIISVALAVPTDNSNRTAFDYLKSNLLGCGVGLVLSLFHLPQLAALCLGVGLTIVLGIGVKLTAPLRPALAAIVVVTITEQKQGQWVPIERVTSVATGCVVALLVSLLVNMLVRRYSVKETAGLPKSEGPVQ